MADHDANIATELMLQRQIIARGVDDLATLEAMRQVPRSLFVSANYADEAYADEPLPIGHGQTISQPFIVALMTQSLLLQPTHRVLEIGTGSGYQTAILAHLAAQVFTIERIATLSQLAQHRIQSLGLTNVHYRIADGTLGWPDAAAFDRILITAAAPGIPRRLLLTQLADSGVAILPAGLDADQTLLRITRCASDLIPEPLCACRFVRLIGHEGWAEANR